MRIINSIRDLHQVVDDLMGQNATEQIVDATVEEILRYEKRPAFGEDWSGFLDNLDLWQEYYWTEHANSPPSY